MKILLIEDDHDVMLALQRGLQPLFRVDTARTAEDGLHQHEVGEYDVVVLDLGLPDIPGIEVCVAMKKRAGAPPILVLTGRADVRTKVAVLDAGADDYLTKPFSLEELKARLRALSRRNRKQNSSLLRVGDLILDTATRSVERDGKRIKLRRKEYALLEYLMQNQGAVITRPMIVDHVWDTSDNLWTNAVDVHIKYLRDVIDRPFSSPLIQTVHGVGYKIGAILPPAIAESGLEGASAEILHDIAQPLSAVSAQLKKLGKRYTATSIRQASTSLRELERYLEAAQKQACTAGGSSTFSIGLELKRAAAIVRHEAERLGVKLVLPRVAGLRISGDPVKFNRMLTNLMSNAVNSYRDTLKPGGQPSVKVEIERGPEGVIITVIDWGRGALPTNINTIFNSGYTTKSASRARHGLGLASAQRIARSEFGGSIAAHRDKQGSTRFVAKLRIVEPSSAPQ